MTTTRTAPRTTPTKRTTPTAAGIYIRISEDSNGARLGVKRQEQDCRALAESRGWPVAQVFEDNDLSAYTGKRRPAYEKMLEAVRAGDIDGIVVWHLDRLTRRPVELEDFFEVADKAGLKHMACVSGDIDLSTHDGQFHARILGAVSRKSSDDSSRRIRRKHQELAEAGKHPGTWSMLAYEYDREAKRLNVVPAEARIVRKVFAMYTDGAGLREIARWLDGQGLTGKRGRTRWDNGAVTRILDNPTYAGLRVREGVFYQGTNWKAIVKRAVWEQTRALRLASMADAPAQNRAGKGNALLSGLIFCSCGERMWRDTYRSRDHRSAYLCRRAARKRWGDCRAGGISALRAERLVSEQFFARVAEPLRKGLEASDVRGLVPDVEPLGVDERLQQLEAKMDRLVDLSLAATGPLAAERFRDKAGRLEDERTALLRERAQATAAGVTGRRRVEDIHELRSRLGDLPKVWEVASVDERRAMLGLAIDRIEVTGTGRPKGTAIQWADWLR